MQCFSFRFFAPFKFEQKTVIGSEAFTFLTICPFSLFVFGLFHTSRPRSFSYHFCSQGTAQVRTISLYSSVSISAPCALEMQQQSLFQSLQKDMNIFSLYSISELGAVLLCRHEVQDKLLFIVRERVYSKHLNGGLFQGRNNLSHEWGDSLFQGRMIYSGIIYHRRIDYSGVEHPGG